MSDVKALVEQLNILIVDDMESIRSLVRASLSTLGAKRVAMAPDGLYAWQILKTNKVDMIICDWDMPKLSGIELLKRVRGSKNHKHIPFLLLTASSDKSRVTDAIRMGVSDYLSKPFQPKELEFRIIKLLRKVKLD